MARIRRYVRPAFHDDGASFRVRRERELNERYGPIIEARRPGLRGWWSRSSPGSIFWTIIIYGVLFSIALPIFLIEALIIYDAACCR